MSKTAILQPAVEVEYDFILVYTNKAPFQIGDHLTSPITNGSGRVVHFYGLGIITGKTEQGFGTGIITRTYYVKIYPPINLSTD